MELTNGHNGKENDFIQITDLFSLYISKWRWVLLSVLVCLFVAGAYLLVTMPVYQRTASIMIKEDRNGQSIDGSVALNLSDIGLVQSNVNIANEVIMFQSPDIIYAMINRLHLDNTYIRPGFFRGTLLYGSTLPCSITFCDLDKNSAAGLEITPIEGNKLAVSNFILDKEELEGELVATFGDTIASPLGKIVFQKNDYYTGEFDFPIRISHSGSSAAVEEFRKKLTVSLHDKNSTVIDLTFNDLNSERTIDELKTIINIYNEFWMKDKNEITFSTNDFINERLRMIEEDLSNVDNIITNYKSSQRVPDIHASAAYTLQLAGENERQIVELNNQSMVSKYLLNYLKNSQDKLLPANVGLKETSIQTQLATYNQLQLQRGRLVESSSEENLMVKDIDQQLKELRGAIINSLENYVSSLDLQIASAEKNRDQLNSRISSNPRQAGHLLTAERQQKVKEGLYLYLLQKKEENEISQAFIPYNTRMVMEPEFGGKDIPSAPRKLHILLAALLLGLILPLGIIFLKESLNTKIRGRKDLEGLSAPYVGEIPLVIKEKKFGFLRSLFPQKETETPFVDIVVKEHNRDVINEAFRVVRTNIEFMQTDKNQSTVIMVTSANVNSGKTFIASNLATSFAIKGKKVIALDLDLRKSTLSKTFISHTAPQGVVDYLRGKEKDYHKLLNHQTLDILPTGVMPPNPAELLATPQLEKLIGELRKEYDYIFIDCPPVEIVADADIVKPWADMTLFVIRANLLEKEILPDIERYYTENHFNHMVIALNGTEAVGHYGYKYGYYKSRYGYYGK